VEGGWKQQPGNAKYISVGSKEHIVCCSPDDRIYRWNGGGWTEVGGSASQCSIGHDGELWVCNSASEIYNWNGGSWQKMPGAAVQPAVLSRHHVYVRNSAGQIYEYQREGNTWKQLPGDASYIDVGKGVLVAATKDDQLYYHTID